MQKLAGLPVKEIVEASQADSTPGTLTEGMHKKKMTKMEAKKMIKDAILAEMSHDDDPRDPHADPHNLPGSQYLDEASTDALVMMDGLVDRQAFEMLLKGARNIIRSLKEEDFEEDDIHDYLVYLVTTLDDSSLMEGSDYDPDAEQDDEEVFMPMDDEGKPLGEVKKDEEEAEDEVEIEDEETVEEPAADEDMIDADMEGDVDMDAGSDEAKTAFDELTDAYRSAKELGDEKLIRQLANTITYFNKNIILK